jgi:YggT family protein
LRGRAGADSLLAGFAPAGRLLPHMHSLANLISIVISLSIWVLIASAIMSWLVAFNVLNTRNRFVYQVGDMLYRLTEPALRPIRRVLPNLGGIDLSPVVLILLLVFIRSLLFEYVFI